MKFGGINHWRKPLRTASKALLVLVAILAITPVAYASCTWIFNTIDPILLATQALQKMQTGFFGAAFSTGQTSQSKIEENHFNTAAVNERTKAQASVAKDIAIAHAIPKSYNACGQAKGAAAGANALAGTASLGRALSLDKAYVERSLQKESEDFAKQIKTSCGPKDGPLYNAKKAAGCTDTGRSDSASDISAVMKESIKAPDSVETAGVGKGTMAEDKGEEYRDYTDAAQVCQKLSPRVGQDSTATKVMPSTPAAVLARERTAVFAGAAQAICHNILAMSLEGGPLKSKQADYCKWKKEANQMDALCPDGMSGWAILSHDVAGYMKSDAYMLKDLSTQDAYNKQTVDTTYAEHTNVYNQIRAKAQNALLIAIRIRQSYVASESTGGAADKVPVQQ